MSIFHPILRTLKTIAGLTLISSAMGCGGDPEGVPEAATPIFRIGAAIGAIDGTRVVIDASGETCRNIEKMAIEVLAENSTVAPDPAALRSYTEAVTFTVLDASGNSRNYTVEVQVKKCNSTATSTSAKPPTSPVPASQEPADKYVGIWDSGCQTDGDSSGTLRATFVKTGSNSYSGTLEGTTYTSTNCSGPVKENNTLSNMGATIIGTKTVAGNTVEKMMITSSEALAKIVALCDGRTLQFGVDQDDLDAEGYPNALFFIVLNKI